MSDTKTFDGFGLSTFFPQRLGCDGEGHSSDATCVAIASMHTALQAELWDGAVSSPCKSAICDQSSACITGESREGRAGCSKRSLANVPAVALRSGACYLRYSAADAVFDSLDEQLELILRQARKHRVWIPLSRVFADVQSRDEEHLRTGLMSLVSLISDPDTSVSVIYVDNFSRLEPGHGQDDLFCLTAQLCGKTVYSVAERPTK
jgi:hypothetical protein